jgi:hypothetical protein
MNETEQIIPSVGQVWKAKLSSQTVVILEVIKEYDSISLIYFKNKLGNEFKLSPSMFTQYYKFIN